MSVLELPSDQLHREKLTIEALKSYIKDYNLREIESAGSYTYIINRVITDTEINSTNSKVTANGKSFHVFQTTKTQTLDSSCTT